MREDRENHLHDDAPPWYYDRALRIPVYSRYHLNRARAVCRKIPRGVGLLLDVGCDGGTITSIIRECSGAQAVVGLDVKADSVAYAASTKEGMDFVAGDGMSLPVRSGSVDVVTMLEVVEHVPDPERMVSEAFRALKAGGLLVVLVPNTRYPLYRVVWWVWTRTFGAVWRDAHRDDFGAEEVKELMDKAGFEIMSEEKINFGMVVLLVARKP